MPFINERNRKRRLTFAEEYLKKDPNYGTMLYLRLKLYEDNDPKHKNVDCPRVMETPLYSHSLVQPLVQLHTKF
ncbi:hypothetical protein QE152_g25363 [Popillia japonica]|uniref:Uncharacterized protein n=1 Tax=Popillia japonica TaxID=7064 RepID=A0AAW1K2Z7_POPJA